MKQKTLYFWIKLSLIILYFFPFEEGRWLVPMGGCLYSQPVQLEWVRTYTGGQGGYEGLLDMALDTSGNIVPTPDLHTVRKATILEKMG